MKTCSICGHQFPDDLKECPVCGAPAPDADANTNTTINTNNGTTPPPVPDDIPPVPEVDGSPKTRIVSNGTMPPSNPGAVPPSGPATVASSAVPPSNPGAVPPSNSGTVPPSGSFNQPPRRNNTVLWVVIGILSAIILIGATWFIATKVLGDDSKSSDNSEDSIGSDVEVVDYETDDTPTQSDTYDADTLAEPDVASNSHSSSTSSDDNTNVITGYLHHSDGDKSCYVRLVFTVDNDSEVSGTVSFNNTTLDISGNYYDGSKKLLIYENGGGRYEGYVNGSTYSGKYYDNDGTWSFSMNVN